MKKSLIKTHTISFQEKTPRGMMQGDNTVGAVLDKSFDCPKEHLEFHLTQLKKMCYDIRVETKKG